MQTGRVLQDEAVGAVIGTRGASDGRSDCWGAFRAARAARAGGRLSHDASTTVHGATAP